MSSGVILLQMPYISLSSPLLLILRWEITTAAAVLYLSPWNFTENSKYLASQPKGN